MSTEAEGEAYILGSPNNHRKDNAVTEETNSGNWQ